MSVVYSKDAHKALIKGEKKAIGWGLSADLSYQLHRAPYGFLFLIDGLKVDSEDTSKCCDLEVHAPSHLLKIDPQDFVIVVFSDADVYGTEIVESCTSYGFDLLTLPFCYWRHESEQRMAQYLADFVGDASKIYKASSDSVMLWLHSLAKGGAERQMVLLAIGFRELGKEVYLVTAHPDKPHTDDWRNELERAGVKRRQLANMRNATFSYKSECPEEWKLLQPSYLQQVVETEALISEIKPEYAISYLDGGNVVLGLAAARQGLNNVVLSGRSLHPGEFPHFSKHPATLNGMSQIYRHLIVNLNYSLVNNSTSGALSYEQWISLESEVIKVIPNTTVKSAETSLNLHQMLNINTGKIIIGGVMRLTKEKRPDWFIKVTADLLNQYNINAEVVLVGDGPLKKMMQEQINELGLCEFFHLVGAVDNAMPYIAGMDMLILTSELEGTPNVLLEAQLCKTPFVSTKVGGVVECVYPQLQEFSLSDENTLDGMIDRILVQFEKKEELAATRNEAQEWVLSRSPKAVAQQYLEVR